MNGRINNLIYGSYAPDAPDVFIDDARFQQLWMGPERNYLVAPDELLPDLRELVPERELIVVAGRGRKVLLTNRPLPVEDPR